MFSQFITAEIPTKFCIILMVQMYSGGEAFCLRLSCYFSWQCRCFINIYAFIKVDDLSILDSLDASHDNFRTTYQNRKYCLVCAVQFDAALRDTFEMYSRLRAAGSIDAMRVHQVASGSFQQLRSLMTTSSLSSSSSAAAAAVYNPQYKVPRVVRDRACLELLLAASIN